MDKKDISKMNTSTLAYLGDAVFEVIVREKIVTEKPGDVDRAHHTAVRYVSAAGQAKAAKAMIAEGFLTEEEEQIYKRARNHRSMSRPQNADPREYKDSYRLRSPAGLPLPVGRQAEAPRDRGRSRPDSRRKK